MTPDRPSWACVIAYALLLTVAAAMTVIGVIQTAPHPRVDPYNPSTAVIYQPKEETQ